MKFVNPLKIDFGSKRNYGLDILRAFAILFVLNIHSAHLLNTDSTLFKILTTLNLDGVSLFFVLSGFLIGGILIKLFEKPPVTFKTLYHFWIRRWFKTLPSYFLILTVLVVLGFHHKSLTGFSQVIGYYFFVANFVSSMPGYLFSESWSLSIEEWFYLLIPLFIFILVGLRHMKPKFSIIAVAVAVIIFVTLYRYFRFVSMPHITGEQIGSSFRKQVVTRLDSLMYGIIGAFLAYYYLDAWKKYKKLLFFIGIFLLYSSFLHYVIGGFNLLYVCVFSFSIQSIGFLCLFPYITDLKSGKGFIYRIITCLSIISYSMYLINYSLINGYIIGFLHFHLFSNISGFYQELTQYFSFWTMTVIGSILLYKYFEKPIMDIRDTIK